MPYFQEIFLGNYENSLILKFKSNIRQFFSLKSLIIFFSIMSHTSLDYSVTWNRYWFCHLILIVCVQCIRKWNQVLLNFENILKSNNYHYPRSFTFSIKTYQKSFKNKPTSHSAIAIIFLDYFFAYSWRQELLIFYYDFLDRFKVRLSNFKQL